MQNSESRKLYLIRHGSAGADKRCISATDIPLDDFGEHQAKRLANWAADKNLTVYSSPLSRALQTANALGAPVTICDELREVNVGLWEGLAFDEIRSRYPEDFQKRGERPGTYPPTGGESIFEAGTRLLRCLSEIAGKTQGEIAVVAHGGINRGALCRLLEKPPDEALLLPQPRGGISEIEVLPGGRMSVTSIGEMPDRYPDSRSTEWLRERYKMPEHIRLHCNAVAQKALQLAVGRNVDTELLLCAAQLHDISRAHGFSHAQDGARLLRESGYPRVSELIACHHDLPDGTPLETQILYLADKLVQGDREVSLHERFEESRKKCKSAEALAAWQRRFDAAVRVARELGLEVLSCE